MQINHAVMRLNLLQCSVRLHHELNMKRPVGSSQCNSLQPNPTPPHRTESTHNTFNLQRLQPLSIIPFCQPPFGPKCHHMLNFFQVSQMEVIKASQINQ